MKNAMTTTKISVVMKLDIGPRLCSGANYYIRAGGIVKGIEVLHEGGALLLGQVILAV